MSCVTACPSGVKYDRLIEDQRAELERHKPRTPGDRLFRAMLFALFPYPARLRFLLFFQILYVKSGLRWLLHKIGLFKIVPRRLAQLERVMPDVGAHHLAARLPVFSAAAAPRRGRVALLAGCVQRVYFPGVNEATIRVLNAEGFGVGLRAAMHDACHLRHAQRIVEQPRKLLGAIPGLTLLEVPDPEQCCGSAGVYNLIQPESADQIGTRKVENVLSISPELLVSGNPGCTLQIQAKLRDRGVTLPALHPIELLDRSIRGEPPPEH